MKLLLADHAEQRSPPCLRGRSPEHQRVRVARRAREADPTPSCGCCETAREAVALSTVPQSGKTQHRRGTVAKRAKRARQVIPTAEDIHDAALVGCSAQDLAESRAYNAARERRRLALLRTVPDSGYDIADEHSDVEEVSVHRPPRPKREYRKCRVCHEVRCIADLVPYSDVRPRSFHCVATSRCAKRAQRRTSRTNKK